MTSIRLTRPNTGSSWGFRIHGGKDFNQPLIILKVNSGSIAEQCGLSPGDALLRINNADALELRHKQAQDLIMNSGNSVELLVQKGATNTWMPKVTPLGEVNSQQKLYTKTSLKKEVGKGYTPASGINSRAKPFAHAKDGRALINNQFNSPIGIYSEQAIKETLSAQAEVLAGGAVGVDFKKNEKPYKYENSEVYKMLKEVENEPAAPAGDEENRSIQIPISNYAPPQQSPSLMTQQSLLKKVKAPETKPEGSSGGGGGGTNPNLCSECERLIVGVFVRIKDKNLHVECFKCATCGQSLKNIGYFNINNKLYCDVHAKSFSKAHPPGPGLEPYTTIPTQTPKHIFSIDSYGNENLQPDTFALQNGQNVALENTYENIGASSTITSSKKTLPVNVKPYAYKKAPTAPLPSLDTYAANIAPQPYHHSPTQAHHVTAPKSPVKAPIQQPLFPSSVGGSTKSSQIYETKSSSFSETITKSGSKFVWPPANKSSDEDQVMMGSNAPPVSEITIPIQQSSYSASNSYSSFGTGATTDQFQNTSTLSSAGAAFGGGAPNAYSSVPPPSFPVTAPLNTYNSPTPGYKPVAPPKPAFKQSQVPYKPVTNLLTTANKVPSMPSPPVSIPSPKIGGGPPFGGPPNFAGPGSLLAGAPITARGKGQFGRGIIPARGKGILTQPGPRIAICGVCQKQIRGPFITATAGKIYCPEHFKCNTPNCKRPLIDIGFVEERGALYCEYCWESYLAPECGKCRRRIKNECLNAIGQHFHPTCFACSHCSVVFGNSPFYLEDGRPFCEKDWNEMFTTKCFACGFPIEAGDRWVEAMTNNYHSQCFNCSACKKNLEGQSFFAKAGRPFCKQHAR